jgi:hypothetical protein
MPRLQKDITTEDLTLLGAVVHLLMEKTTDPQQSE